MWRAARPGVTHPAVGHGAPHECSLWGVWGGLAGDAWGVAVGRALGLTEAESLCCP